MGKRNKVLYDGRRGKKSYEKKIMADMGGQLAPGVMAGNLVGQLTYFYTDKVGMWR